MTDPILGNVTYKTNTDGDSAYSPWEHLQSTLRKQHNRLVGDFFRDITDINFNSLTPRASLKMACWMDDNDTATMTQLRLFLFYVVTGHLKNITEPYFSIPVEEVEAVRKYRPQVVLVFREDLQDVEDGYNPVRGRISYRIMGETSETISKTELTALANKIKTEFGASKGYIWDKGKDMAVYTDKENGYEMQLLVRSEAAAKTLIGKVLDLEGKTPDWANLQYKVNSSASSAYPTLPPQNTIMGKQYREARKRPIASCRFQYAEARIYGIKRPIILYDRSFAHSSALVTDYG